MVTFYGKGSVYIPKSHSFVRFAGGKYATGDSFEIEVLAQTYRHDTGVIQTSLDDIDDDDDEIVQVDKPKRGRKPKV